jgi:hypothetical protein
LLTHLDANAAVREQAHPFSERGVVEQIGRTLAADVRLVTPDSGPAYYEISRAGVRLGTLWRTEVQQIQRQMLRQSPNGRVPVTISASGFGAWQSSPPAVLLDLRGEDMNRGGDAFDKANYFANAMMQASTLFRDNVAPEQRPGESEADYRARIQSLGIMAPEAYFNQIEALIRDAQQRSGFDITNQLAILKLVGTERRAVRASVDVSEQAMKEMIERGRSNVQRFGAFALLAPRTSLSGDQLTVNASGLDAGAVLNAAKILFGDRVQASTQGGNIVLTGLNFGSDERRNALAALFGAVRLQDNRLSYGDLDDATVRRLLNSALGGAFATTGRGAIVFDNRGYDRVHFGEALSAVTSGTIPGFATLEPLSNQGSGQVWDQPWDYQLSVTGNSFHRADLEFLLDQTQPRQ